MFRKYAIATSVGVGILVSPIAWGQQSDTSSDSSQTGNESSRTVGNQSAAESGTSGVPVQQSAPGLASAMANFMVRTGLVVGPDAQGRLVVEQIRPESDAARLGIKPGDVLSSVNGAPTKRMSDLQNYLTSHQHQSAFSIGTGREGKALTQPMGRQMSLMGMTIFPDSSDRPYVYSVEPGSAAAKRGVKAGDVIVGVGHQTTDTMSKFMNMSIPLVRALDPGEGVPFRLMRNGKPVKVAVARPSDSQLEPATPAEQRVLDRQGGVLSTATQEPERPKQQDTKQKRSSRGNGQKQDQNRPTNAAMSELPAATTQNPNQNQNQNGLGGGVGLGLDGLGGGLGTGTTGTSGTGGTSGGMGMNGNQNSVVAALYGTQQNASNSQGTSTTGQSGITPQSGATGQGQGLGQGQGQGMRQGGGMGQGQNQGQGGNNFANAGVVGYVTIQSTVPLSQSANNTNGMNNGTNGTGVGATGTGTGTTGTGVGTTGTGTGTAGTGVGTAGAGTTGLGTNGLGANTGATGVGTNGVNTGAGAGNVANNSGIGTGNTATSTGANTQIPQIGEGGTNPITGNTGTAPGVNPQTGNGSNNNNNGNNPSTVSAQVSGLPNGVYTLSVTQYGNCGAGSSVATGPIAASLGTIQVQGGQGTLASASVPYTPQAFVGRVVQLSTSTGGGSIAARGSQQTNTSTNANTGVLACGVFRYSRSGQPFTNGYGNGAGTNNGSNNGQNTTGTTPITGGGSPIGGGGQGPVAQPLGGGAAGAGGVGGGGVGK